MFAVPGGNAGNGAQAEQLAALATTAAQTVYTFGSIATRGYDPSSKFLVIVHGLGVTSPTVTVGGNSAGSNINPVGGSGTSIFMMNAVDAATVDVVVTVASAAVNCRMHLIKLRGLTDYTITDYSSTFTSGGYRLFNVEVPTTPDSVTLAYAVSITQNFPTVRSINGNIVAFHSTVTGSSTGRSTVIALNVPHITPAQIQFDVTGGGSVTSDPVGIAFTIR